MVVRRSALLCPALAVLALGCSRSVGEQELSAILGNPAEPQEIEARRYQEHDLGVILADGQVLRHEFTLKNPTGAAIRLLRATALTPCCSAIGPLPKEIPPRAEVKIPVIFKPGYQSGLRGVRFAVDTDEKQQPVRLLALRASLSSAFEMEPLADSSTSLPLGQAGKQTFRVTARRKGAHGRGLPETTTASAPLVVAFVGGPSAESEIGGLTEAGREVVVLIPPEKKPGPRRGELVFGWRDGHTETRTIAWEVKPRLEVSPSGLVVRESSRPIEQRVTVTSDRRPFMIEKVASPLLVSLGDLPRDAATTQHIVLTLDTSRAVPERASDVMIRTDHPTSRWSQ